MSANSILQFCPTVGADNLMDDATYLAASTRVNGNQPGIADDHLINKALRQATLLAAALAQYTADNQGTDVNDALSAATLRTMLSAAIDANYGPTHHFVNTPAGADTITGTVAKLAAYVAGDFFYWIQPATNITTAPTLNLNAVGAVPIIRPSGSIVAIGELPINQLMIGIYDGTSIRCIAPISKSSIQNQVYTRFTAGGTADAVTMSPVPTVILGAGIRLTTTPPGANTVTNPTLAVNGGTATVIKKKSNSGLVALIAGDYNSSGPFTFEYDGTQWVLLDPINTPIYSGYSALHVITGTTTLTNADFGKLILMSGSGYTVTLPSAASGSSGNRLAFESTGTNITLARAGSDVMQMNSSNALTSVVFNDGDTLSMATNSGTQWEMDSGGLQLPYSSVAASSATTQTGTSTLSFVTPAALAASMIGGVGQTWQSVTRTAGTTYFNTTGRPILLKVDATSTSAAQAGCTIVVNGLSLGPICTQDAAGGAGFVTTGTMIIPPGASYVLTDVAATHISYELR